MTLEEATRAVLEELNRKVSSSNEEMVLLDRDTMVKPYGWIFFYNSRRFVETGNVIYALGGNGPVVVERTTGRITHLGTARPFEEEVADFEGKNYLSAK